MHRPAERCASTCPLTILLASPFLTLSPFGAAGTMRVAGVIEIVAGLVVLLRPRIGAYVVAAWLAGIILGAFYAVSVTAH
jgi:uncharacterized membrane protein HdeD (DUF308 family)